MDAYGCRCTDTYICQQPGILLPGLPRLNIFWEGDVRGGVSKIRQKAEMKQIPTKRKPENSMFLHTIGQHNNSVGEGRNGKERIFAQIIQS